MPNFDESKGFKLKSGNTPLFKQIGTPAKNYSVEKGSHDHPHGESPATMYGETPVKHTRSREGHMDTYGTHTNADHPNYWKKGEDGTTPKSKEVEADTKTKTTKTDTKTTETDTNTEVTTPKKKKSLLDKLREGHKSRKKTDADYKANKKSGESKYQYKKRKKSEANRY